MTPERARALRAAATQGEWSSIRVGRDGDGSPRSAEVQVCAGEERDAPAVFLVQGDGSLEWRANVVLAAAAPELVDAYLAEHETRAAAERALEEREGDMHARIRAGYDRAVADSWRAALAAAEERAQRAEAEAARLRDGIMRMSTPYPLHEVLGHLIDCADHYLNYHGGDRIHWEHWHSALSAAREIRAALAPQPPQPEARTTRVNPAAPATVGTAAGFRDAARIARDRAAFHRRQRERHMAPTAPDEALVLLAEELESYVGPDASPAARAHLDGLAASSPAPTWHREHHGDGRWTDRQVVGEPVPGGARTETRCPTHETDSGFCSFDCPDRLPIADARRDR